MFKKFSAWILILIFAFSALTACDAPEADGEEGSVPDTLSLVVDGVSDYVIVRGENAYISEVTASEQLQLYLKQITGAELPIVTDSAEVSEKEIVVGKTNREAEGQFDRAELGDDGFVIQTVGEKLFLVGGEQRGTLYSVFEFLEAYADCRFYTNSFEIIPAVTTLSIDPIAEDKQIPVIKTRVTNWYRQNGSTYKPKRKLSGSIHGGVDAAWGGSEVWSGFGGGHTVNMMINGVADDGRGDNPCLTSDENFQKALATTRRFLSENPNTDYISISQTDNDRPCECENCEALLAEVGEQSGLYIYFVNRVAEAIKDEYPDVLIHTFAYRHTYAAPKNITVADNIIVQLCSWNFCSNHVYGQHECDDDVVNVDFDKHLADWKAIAKNVSIWDYTPNFAHYNSPYPNFHVLREDIKLFAESGVEYVFEQGNAESTDSSFGDLRSYLVTELLWDPYMSEEEYNGLMVQFLKDYYGSGWEYILEFINASKVDQCIHLYMDPLDIYGEKLNDIHDKMSYPEIFTEENLRNWETTDWSSCIGYYNDVTRPEIIDVGRELFAKAEAAAETEDQKWRVRKESLQIEYLELHYEGFRLNETDYNGLNKAVTNFLYFSDEELSFTSDEMRDFKRNFPENVRLLLTKDYAEKNRAFAEKLLSYGITSVREGSGGNITNFDTLDFTAYPHSWKK